MEDCLTHLGGSSSPSWNSKRRFDIRIGFTCCCEFHGRGSCTDFTTRRVGVLFWLLAMATAQFLQILGSCFHRKFLRKNREMSCLHSKEVAHIPAVEFDQLYNLNTNLGKHQDINIYVWIHNIISTYNTKVHTKKNRGTFWEKKQRNPKKTLKVTTTFRRIRMFWSPLCIIPLHCMILYFVKGVRDHLLQKCQGTQFLEPRRSACGSCALAAHRASEIRSTPWWQKKTKRVSDLEFNTGFQFSDAKKRYFHKVL